MDFYIQYIASLCYFMMRLNTYHSILFSSYSTQPRSYTEWLNVIYDLRMDEILLTFFQCCIKKGENVSKKEKLKQVELKEELEEVKEEKEKLEKEKWEEIVDF